MNKVFFGFGHGYGGTHLLAKILNLVPSVYCDHEIITKDSPRAMFDKYQEVYRGELPAEDVVTKERLPFVKEVWKSGKDFGEINGMLAFYVEGLFKVFPNARFIYMMRDPRTQIRSIHNSGIFDYEVFAGRDMWWWPSPRKDDPHHDEWDRMSKLEKCAWSWRLVNSSILELFEDVPEERIFRYKFEDMTKGKRIDELCAFLQIPAPNPAAVQRLTSIKHAKTPTVVSDPLPPWGATPQSRKNEIARVAGPISKIIGYGDLND